MEVSSKVELGDTSSQPEGRKGSVNQIKERVGSFTGDELNKRNDLNAQVGGPEKAHHDLGIMHVAKDPKKPDPTANVEKIDSNPPESKSEKSQDNVAIPHLPIDGKYITRAICNGCWNDIRGIWYDCLQCDDFAFCSVCMQSALREHADHRFKSSEQDLVYTRKYSERPRKGAEKPRGGEAVEAEPPEDGTLQPEYAVHTKYTDIYMGDYDDVIGEFSTTKRRTTTDGTRRNIPVLEQIRTFKTSLRTAVSQTYLEGLDIKDSVVRVHVHSKYILNALRAIVSYYPGFSLGDRSLMDMEENVWLLYHHRTQLLEYKKNHPENHGAEYIEECNKHIDEVVSYLDSEFPHRLERFEAQLKQPEPAITYDQLGMLFKPGTEIYARINWDGQVLQPFVVAGFFEEAEVEDDGRAIRYRAPETCFRIIAWNFDCDGDEFGRSAATIDIKPFKDEQKVRSLPCFPTSIIDGTEEGKTLREKFIKRGKKFFNISKHASYMQYTGSTKNPPRRNYTAARCMCDARCEPWRDLTSDEDEDQLQRPHLGQFARETVNTYSGCMCESCADGKGPSPRAPPFRNWDGIRCNTVTELEDHQYFICCGYIYGYILKERQWRLLDVENLQEPDIDYDAINQLELEQSKTKDLIKAICQNYTSKDSHLNYAADFIQGKGEGHIFLLHGPPGVGKTLTAECVAEFTGRPLLPLTGGDIGSNADAVERNLRNFLRLGQDWNAVVLLDEADVYLSSRDGVGIERNSVISVFLREIEYYRGILFLTTNRVGAFDEAILSRIHFPLHFSKFDDERRMQVWNNNFDRLEEKRKGDIEIHYNVKAYVEDKLAKLEWNGREIRNAFQTAVSLAFYDAQRKSEEKATKTGKKDEKVTAVLKMDHLEQVVNMSNNFKDYMKRTHRGDDPAMIALQKLLRDDRSEHERQQEEKGTPAKLRR